MEKQPYIKYNSIDNLINKKELWIDFFNSASIPFVDIEQEYGVDIKDTTMPDFYFPKIDWGNHFGKTQDFFASLDYTPYFLRNYKFQIFESYDLHLRANKRLKYLDFLVKNKKPIVFLKDELDFTPTTVFTEPEYDRFYEARMGIPFAYFMKQSYGSIWWAGNDDENFTKDYTTIINEPKNNPIKQLL